MLSIENIAEISNKYPSAKGIILTGSFLERGDFQTDIDIVIIDTQFSVVSSVIIYSAKKKYDITHVPLNDVSNILFNEMYDSRGVILSMISKGTILKDDEFGTVKMIKEESILLFKNGNYNINNHYNESIRNLSKLRKQFDIKLDLEERFLLVNEFVRLVTEAELARQTGWLPLPKLKARILNMKKPFINELIFLTQTSLLDDNSRLTSIGEYIDLFIANFNLSDEAASSDRLVLDITYPTFNLAQFCTTILKLVDQNELLKNSYLYFFLSPRLYHHIYSHQICLVFKTNEELTSKIILQTFRELLSKQLHNSLKISLRANAIYLNKNPSAKSYYLFEPVAFHLNIMIRDDIHKAGRFDGEKFFFIVIIFWGFIMRYIDADLNDILQLNDYLLQRWTFNKEEQQKIKDPSKLYVIGKKKRYVFNQYFTQNKDFLVSAFKKGMSLKELDGADSEKIYFNSIKSLKPFVDNLMTDYSGLQYSDHLTIHILQNTYKIKELNKAIVFVIAIEHVIRLLKLEDIHTCMSIFVTSQIINDLRNK